MFKRIYHLGWITDSLKTIIAHKEAGFEVKVINTHPYRSYEKVPEVPFELSVTVNIYNDLAPLAVKLNKVSMSLIKKCFISRKVTKRLLDESEKEPPDLIFGNWGVGALQDLAILKKVDAFKNAPIILNMETFPTAWKSGLHEFLDIRAFKNLSNIVDGLVVPTPELKQFMLSLCPELETKKIYEHPFFYPQSYSGNFSTASKNRKEDKDLVFIGQLDYSRSLNDVGSQLTDLADTGLSVWCHTEEGFDHPNIYQFPYFDGGHLLRGEMAEFLRKFKACLVTYNFENKATRFDTSLPSRFLLAVQSGVPVAIPKGKFKAMESFLLKHDIGILYEGAEDLYQQLNDSNWKDIQQRIEQKAQRFTFNSEQWKDFIKEVAEAC